MPKLKLASHKETKKRHFQFFYQNNWLLVWSVSFLCVSFHSAVSRQGSRGVTQLSVDYFIFKTLIFCKRNSTVEMHSYSGKAASSNSNCWWQKGGTIPSFICPSVKSWFCPKDGSLFYNFYKVICIYLYCYVVWHKYIVNVGIVIKTFVTDVICFTKISLTCITCYTIKSNST